jgi:hypothetical protein
LDHHGKVFFFFFFVYESNEMKCIGVVVVVDDVGCVLMCFVVLSSVCLILGELVVFLVFLD